MNWFIELIVFLYKSANYKKAAINEELLLCI